MAGGRLFQTRGPATANALSRSDVVVRGMSSIILAADREPGRPQPACYAEDNRTEFNCAPCDSEASSSQSYG